MRDWTTPREPNGAASHGEQGAREEWTTTRPPVPRLLAGEVDAAPMDAVRMMPAGTRFAAWWREAMRQTAKAFGVSTEGRVRWVPWIGLGLTFLLALAGFGRTFWQTEGRVDSQAQQLLTAAGEIRESMVAMRGELMGEVSAIRGSVSQQQRQLDKLDADVRAQLEQKDKDIARLEAQVQTAMAYAQSADKNIARLQERLSKNGG
jgi:hypothetical protein